jgi:hypothetical protein
MPGQSEPKSKQEARQADLSHIPTPIQDAAAPGGSSGQGIRYWIFIVYRGNSQGN